jgi:signal transduction histidine kinase
MSLAREVRSFAPIAGAYQSIFEGTPCPLALVAPGRPAPQVVRSNAAFDHAFGLPPRGAEGLCIDKVFRGAASHQLTEAVERCFSEGLPIHLRIADAPTGEIIRIEVQVTPIALEGAQLALLGATELKPPALADLNEEGVLAEIGPLSRGLVFIRDLGAGLLRYGPHPLTRLLALPRCGVVESKYILSLVHPDDVERFKAFGAAQSVAADAAVSGDTFRLRRADGRWLWLNLRTRVFTRDQQGGVQRVIGVASDVTAEREHAAALAEASQALSNAEQNERRRIGRELHDATSQLLVAARLNLGAVERRVEAAPDVMALLDEARRSIAEAQKEIRNLSFFLHPPWLEVGGLHKTLKEFAAGFGGRTGLQISVVAGGQPRNLSSATELALFRVAQEALMNVYNHSGAQSAKVRLSYKNGSAILEIEDDGMGLNTSPGAPVTPGVGISGMQARMTQLGGSLTLGSRGKGLLVQAVAPAP